MAQKRMFDRAIIDTDRFMDLGMTAKALYFLLGMEADDEGFVSYKKVMRIHGGNEDDMKVLTAKGFILHFPSGVVVITDWHSNNYLDSRRLRPTEYQDEKKMLVLTPANKYEFSNGLASIEERSRVENNISEVGLRVEYGNDEDKPARKPPDQNSVLIRKEMETKLGRKFPNPVAQQAAIVRMLEAGYTKKQILEEYQWALKDRYWSTKGVDFKVIANIIHKEHD